MLCFLDVWKNFALSSSGIESRNSCCSGVNLLACVPIFDFLICKIDVNKSKHDKQVKYFMYMLNQFFSLIGFSFPALIYRLEITPFSFLPVWHCSQGWQGSASAAPVKQNSVPPPPGWERFRRLLLVLSVFFLTCFMTILTSGNSP